MSKLFSLKAAFLPTYLTGLNYRKIRYKYKKYSFKAKSKSLNKLESIVVCSEK